MILVFIVVYMIDPQQRATRRLILDLEGVLGIYVSGINFKKVYIKCDFKSKNKNHATDALNIG